jgi:hypothetical protein
MKRNLTRFLAIALAFTATAPMLRGDETPVKSDKLVGTASKKTSKKTKVEAKTVEMFQAMDQGLLTVDYIGKDATQANLLFKNLTGEPLDIVLPSTFGAVHVLAQGMMGMGGGGMGGMGGGMGGMGGMMRVQPDKVQKMTVATLCLEHGKADPTPRMKYKVVRLSEVNNSPVVEELCKAVATGKVSQNTAQAAAWHVANGLTWESLVHKPRVISQYTGVEMYFSQFEVQAAMRLTSFATLEAEKNASAYESSSESSSSEEESVGLTLSK